MSSSDVQPRVPPTVARVHHALNAASEHGRVVDMGWLFAERVVSFTKLPFSLMAE
jgi:hypothetical protein